MVISLYDLTAKFIRPWADAGYDCYCVDIQHKPGEVRLDNITFVGTDMVTGDHTRSWSGVHFIVSFCDDAALAAGYFIDIQRISPVKFVQDNIAFVGTDIRDWGPPLQVVDKVAFISSFSLCDDAACSGVRWFRV